MNTIKLITDLTDFTLHHVGLSLITLAFLFLAIHVFLGNIIRVPKLFFILYGIGCIFLIYEMHMKRVVAAMELLNVLCALFLSYKSK